MKKVIIAALVLLFGIGMTTDANAQGLGGLLKKGKEAVKKGQKILEQTVGTENTQKVKVEQAQTAASQKVSSMNLGNGIEVINPLSEYIEVIPVGLYGVEKSENYADAYLVMKVTMKLPNGHHTHFGTTNHDEKMFAVDSSGNVLEIDAGGSTEYNTPEGIQVNVSMDQAPMMIQNIKKGTTVLPMVKLGTFIDARHRGQITFKNVPIYWPEKDENQE